MTTDLDKIEELARAVPPGPWDTWSDDEEGRLAAYFAALPPEVTLELVQRLRAAEAALSEATAMNIRDMRTVGEYNAMYHEANDRLRAAEAIVRDLAAENRVNYESDHLGEKWGWQCYVCGVFAEREKDKVFRVSAMRIDEHAASCPYRRAVEARR